MVLFSFRVKLLRRIAAKKRINLVIVLLVVSPRHSNVIQISICVHQLFLLYELRNSTLESRNAILHTKRSARELVQFAVGLKSGVFTLRIRYFDLVGKRCANQK